MARRSSSTVDYYYYYYRLPFQQPIRSQKLLIFTRESREPREPREPRVSIQPPSSTALSFPIHLRPVGRANRPPAASLAPFPHRLGPHGPSPHASTIKTVDLNGHSGLWYSFISWAPKTGTTNIRRRAEISLKISLIKSKRVLHLTGGRHRRTKLHSEKSRAFHLRVSPLFGLSFHLSSLESVFNPKSCCYCCCYYDYCYCCSCCCYCCLRCLGTCKLGPTFFRLHFILISTYLQPLLLLLFSPLLPAQYDSHSLLPPPSTPTPTG